jgi:hypothetical protein
LRRSSGQCLEPLELQGEMHTSLRARDRVNLVHDHHAHVGEHPATPGARQQDVERFRRRDQDVRSLSQHPRACRGGSIPGANRDTNFGKHRAGLLEPLPEIRQRPLEIPLDVVVERLERRDVENANGIGQRLGESVDDEGVELPQKGGQGLARAGRRENQRVAATRDRRPTLPLGLARRA